VRNSRWLILAKFALQNKGEYVYGLESPDIVLGRKRLMRDVAVVGAGMTRFTKHIDRSMKDLAREAVENALRKRKRLKRWLSAMRWLDC
jgi:hypothetical protein